MDVKKIFLRSENAKRWGIRIMMVSFLFALIFFVFQVAYFFNKYDRKAFDYSDEQLETQRFNLDVLPIGKVIWMNGIGPKDASKSEKLLNQYEYYQIGIYNPYTNVISRVTVPTYVAIYLRDVQYVVRFNAFRNIYPDSIKFKPDSVTHNP